MAKKKKTAKKRGRKVLKTVFLSILLLIVLASVAFGGMILAMMKTSPSLNINDILTLNETSKLYDNKNQFMDNIISRQKRSPAKFNEMPKDLKDAFVSIEDERFYKHSGIDLKRITGAVLIDIKSKITKKRNIQGASTITQQLIKNSVLTPEVSIKRKVQEIYLSVNLEKLLTKDQIIGAYLNTIYLGRGAWGVGAASEQYFSKNIKDLNLLECAYLAGVTQSPSVYDAYSPTSQKNPSIYLNRTKTVLNKMYENGYITNEQYTQSIDDINNGKLKFNPSKSVDKMQHEWFSREVINQVKRDLKSTYGYSDTQVNNLLMQGGLKIYTTMDKDIQNNTQEIINNMNNILGIRKFAKDNISQPQAAAVITDYRTGEVKAIIGGKGDQPAMSLNRATDDLNPCGSTIKPLSVYGPAIDTKMLTAASIFNDNPLPKDFQNKYNGYNPQNSPKIYDGKIPLREGLKKSKNVVAVQVEDTIGLKTGITYAEKFGLKLSSDDKSSLAALSLGEISGTTPMIMASAYGVFGNNGMRTQPRVYRKIVDRTGKVILESKFESTKVISPASAYVMYDLLKEPLTYTGTNANFSPMARGKTGTTSSAKDLWFCGLTPYYSASIWIGADKNMAFNKSSIIGRRIGSNDAALLWGKIMKYAHKDLPYKTIEKPSGVEEVTICSTSGKIVNPFCLQQGTTFTELFLNGTAPSDFCNIHKGGFTPKIQEENPDKKNDKENNKNADKANTTNNNTTIDSTNTDNTNNQTNTDNTGNQTGTDNTSTGNADNGNGDSNSNTDNNKGNIGDNGIKGDNSNKGDNDNNSN